MRTATLYLLQPVLKDGGWLHLKPGLELLTVDLFPPNVHLVQFRYAAVYSMCAFATGDVAIDIRRFGVSRLKIVEVSDISGFAKAVATGFAKDVSSTEEPTHA